MLKLRICSSVCAAASVRPEAFCRDSSLLSSRSFSAVCESRATAAAAATAASSARTRAPLSPLALTGLVGRLFFKWSVENLDLAKLVCRGPSCDAVRGSLVAPSMGTLLLARTFTFTIVGLWGLDL